MRGSVANWIWIAGGIIAGLIVFVTAYSMLSQATNTLSEQKSMAPFYNLKGLIENDLCFSTRGNARRLDISLSEEMTGLYATDRKYENLEDANYTSKVLGDEVSKGNLLCLKRKDRRVICENLSCPVEMPYLGSIPEEQSLSAMIDKVLGRHKTFEYSLNLIREPNYIRIVKA